MLVDSASALQFRCNIGREYNCEHQCLQGLEECIAFMYGDEGYSNLGVVGAVKTESRKPFATASSQQL